MSDEKHQYSERLKRFAKAASELTYTEMMEFAFQIYVRFPEEIEYDTHTVADAIISTAYEINPTVI